MSDEEQGIWNGGNTYTRRELEILRKQEDYYDATDSEKETREELVKREEMMKEESNYKEIQSNHKVSRKPMHELYNNIDYEKKHIGPEWPVPIGVKSDVDYEKLLFETLV